MLLAAQVPAEGPSPTSVFAWVMAAFFLWAWTMDAIGIHAIFGGFILGVCLPRGALTERLQGMVVVVVLSLFFTYSGLKTQPSVLLDPAILLQAVAILLASFDGKAIACWAATRLSGESPRDAEAIGAPINARGLMELIIINIGLQAGIIEPGLFTIVVVMAILTALMATPLFNLIMRRTAVS